MVESTPNDYQPQCPEGFIGMRSKKRRIFVKLVNGRMPVERKLEDILADPTTRKINL
jgi:hypothetical protein